jgi:hypothetical protein
MSVLLLWLETPIEDLVAGEQARDGGESASMRKVDGVELVARSVEVGFDGAVAEPENCADFGISLAAAGPQQNLPFARRQPEHG